MKKTLVVLLLVAVLALGCSNLFAADKIKVTVMYNANEFSPDNEKTFEAENPDIDIVRLETDMARFMAMNAAGNPPDIMRCNGAQIPYLVNHKMALPLDSLISKGKYVKKADLLSIQDNFKYKGKLYGYIKDWSPTMIGYYNMNVFDQAGIKYPSATEPITYQQLADLGRKLQKMDGDRIVVRGLAIWPGGINDQLQLAMITLGEELYSKDGSKIVLTTNPNVKSIMKFYYDLAKEKVIESAISPSETWAGSLFSGGRIAMLFYGYWYGAMAEGEATKGKIGVMCAPQWDPKKPRVSPSHNLVGGFMSSKTKNKEAAYRVFDWFFGGPPALDRATGGWGVPPLKSLLGKVSTDTAFGKQRAENLATELKYVKMDHASQYIMPDVYANSITKNFELALKGDISLDQCLINTENEVNKAIANEKASIK